MCHGIVVECQNCSYAQEFYLGNGFANCVPEVGLTFTLLRSKNARTQIQQILETETVTDVHYAYELCQCDRCQRLYSRFYVEIKYNHNSTYQTTYRCSKCKRILTRVQFEDLQGSDDIPCPTCHQKSLQITEYFHWD